MKNGFFESIIIIFTFSIFSYFYLKTIFRTLDKMVPRPRPKSGINLEAESIEEEINLESKHRAEMKQKITRYSTAEPEKVASLLAKWLLNGM